MLAATLLFVLSAAPPARTAASPYRVKLLLGGGYEVGTQSFTQAVLFEQFAETAAITTAYGASGAPGFDVAVQFNAFKRIGFSLAGTLYERDLDGRFEALLPHPLFFDQPRSAAGDVRGKLTERAGHANVVFFGQRGTLDYSGWAGISLFSVDADLLTDVTYSHSSPYDTVTVTGTPVTTVSDQPAGFNVGASLDYRISGTVGFGLQVRFSLATAKLAGPNAVATEVNVGGFQAGGGIRLYF